MPTITTILLTVLGSGGLFTFIQFLFTRHDTRKNYITKNELDGEISSLKSDLTLLQEAALASMQDRLEFIMTRYLEIGKITVNQYKSLTHMVEVYHELGGNSFVTEMYEKCKELM